MEYFVKDEFLPFNIFHRNRSHEYSNSLVNFELHKYPLIFEALYFLKLCPILLFVILVPTENLALHTKISE